MTISLDRGHVHMNRDRVKSSNINSVGYDQEQSILEVEFKSGAVYQYEGVTAEQHSDMLAAESVGKYFNTHIRTAFEGKVI